MKDRVQHNREAGGAPRRTDTAAAPHRDSPQREKTSAKVDDAVLAITRLPVPERTEAAGATVVPTLLAKLSAGDRKPGPTGAGCTDDGRVHR